jgi:Tol biopolymer transport system component
MSPFVRRTARLAAAALATALVVAAAPRTADAQYFGQNLVQYRSFDFRVLRTPHFDIYYYPEEEAAVRDASRMAERWYARLSRVLDYEFESRQPIILYAAHPHFQQTTALGGGVGEGTGGVTEAFKQRVILPFASSYEDTDHVLGHELVHAFQYDISGLGRAGGGLEEAARRFNVPLWFIEGMAEYLSVGPVDPHTAMWMRDAALTNDLPTIEQLNYDPSFFPYRWGQALWAYIGGRWGDATVGQILKQVGQGVPFEDAFVRILNADLDEITTDWHASIRRTYLPLIAEQREASEEARPLITQRGRGGRYNLAPALSPDGRRVVFISELEGFDIELFVADAETGQIQRRLQRGTTFDPHFGSLRYINSAGVWSPDGTRFAFSALRKAQDVVVILDVNRARIVREYEMEGVDEITNPTWSPDGSTIVFSGMSGGVSNLWALDLSTGRARQLTNDAFADLQPAFSPDGRTLAFVTDRAGTDLAALRWGNYRIALMDWASGEIRALQGFEDGKNINPQWTSDSQGFYFISDRTGISNVYRYTLAGGGVTQVTRLFTGVSGITDLSPAISSASRTDKLVFTAYEREVYNLYSLTDAAELAGTAPAPRQVAQSGDPLPAILPPSPRPTEPAYNRVLALVRDPSYGLPAESAEQTYAVAPYRARLSLDYLGQPSVGVSGSTGPYSRGGVYGGVGGIFSDMLGEHTVYGVVQAQGQIEEIGFNAIYLNRKNRVNWGAAIQRQPYLAGGRRQVIDGNLLRDQLLIFRYFDTSLYGIAQYPFSRVQRLEAAAGVRRIAQDLQIREYIYQNQGGTFVGPLEYRETEEDLESYNLAEGSLALVYDNAVFGYTSPFAGQRYRFEVAPTVGDLQVSSVTADFRRYQLLRPLTLALRGIHYGRYGRDEAVFSPLFLGYPSLLRGYSYGSVTDACLAELEASADGGQECEVYDELFGSRVAAVNVELRLPILRQLIVGNRLGLPPVELFAFFDAGTAWGAIRNGGGTGDEDVETSTRFRFGPQAGFEERGILSSAGVGSRINVFGYLIVEVDFVRPLDRPRGWHWQFAFQPGF